MRIGPTTPVRSLMQHGPDVQEALSWHGIVPAEHDPWTLLNDVCSARGLDMDEVLAHLRLALDLDDVRPAPCTPT